MLTRFLAVIMLLNAYIETSSSEDVFYFKCSKLLSKIETTTAELRENEEFIDALGFKESSNRYNVVNSIGAMGRWQFMPGTLKDLGLSVTPAEFRADPSIFSPETQLVMLHKKFNSDIKQLQDQWFRKNDIDYFKYIGKTVRGRKITLAGLLAASHLGGVYGTMKYFDTGGKYNPTDAYGTSIESYLFEFSEYNFNIVNKTELKCLQEQLKYLAIEEHSLDMEIALTSELQSTSLLLGLQQEISERERY